MAATKLQVKSRGLISGSNNQLLPSIQLSLDFKVEKNYLSSDGSFKTNTRRDLIAQISKQLPCETLTPDIISGMFSGMNVPFPLEGFEYRPYYDHETVYELDKLDDLVNTVMADARWTVAKFSNCGRKILVLNINIEKIVILSSQEIQAMDRAKEMEKRVLELHQFVSWIVRVRPGMDFDGIWKEIAMRVRNTAPKKAQLDERYERNLLLSLMDRTMREYLGYDRLVPASTSSIEGLETIKFEENNDRGKVCAICRDDMFIGSEVSRMPCSHTYHQVCILEWLKRSHMCPLCRFELPSQPHGAI